MRCEWKFYYENAFFVLSKLYKVRIDVTEKKFSINLN